MNIRNIVARLVKSEWRVASVCGHWTLLKGTVSLWDTTEHLVLKPNSEGSPDYCVHCLAMYAIRCAWCGRAIFIGDEVTLRIPWDETLVPAYATIYNHSPHDLVVGCTREECSDLSCPFSDGVLFLDRNEHIQVRRFGHDV